MIASRMFVLSSILWCSVLFVVDAEEAANQSIAVDIQLLEQKDADPQLLIAAIGRLKTQFMSACDDAVTTAVVFACLHENAMVRVAAQQALATHSQQIPFKEFLATGFTQEGAVSSSIAASLADVLFCWPNEQVIAAMKHQNPIVRRAAIVASSKRSMDTWAPNGTIQPLDVEGALMDLLSDSDEEVRRAASDQLKKRMEWWDEYILTLAATSKVLYDEPVRALAREVLKGK